MYVYYIVKSSRRKSLKSIMIMAFLLFMVLIYTLLNTQKFKRLKCVPKCNICVLIRTEYDYFILREFYFTSRQTYQNFIFTTFHICRSLIKYLNELDHF